MKLTWLELKLPPVLLVIILMVVMTLVKTLDLSLFEFARQTEVGGILAGFGLVVIAAGVMQFDQAKTTVNPVKPNETSRVVSTGIYSITRNPMYLGMLFVLTGWCVYLGIIANLAFLVVFVLYMVQFQIKPEEKILRQMFGEEYDEYVTRVRRWI
ncbi:isoprenylcysteine carboxylmethyltransferase family protein [Psychrosphaera sp. B3R10]|uniref:methyltransferase family protein n=1 Tax=unclassified Psychrosphaera TaxID=2641570 RepID=UPI001C09B922|nr:MULTISPECIES: isoprenylcysteine carboxylmethyltransferase family protein [unclassified Psychrosphaera]MBU2883366.1 isoprenylcysteine carboxylmethyltransferase family protein [Psychrosphaera sp. I2R16]MBU2990540.1 isoprenylcysteine carboxylmethyltransferase family protein [Psychrosphaera sp. B3R10]